MPIVYFYNEVLLDRRVVRHQWVDRVFGHVFEPKQRVLKVLLLLLHFLVQVHESMVVVFALWIRTVGVVLLVEVSLSVHLLLSHDLRDFDFVNNVLSWRFVSGFDHIF